MTHRHPCRLACRLFASALVVLFAASLRSEPVMQTIPFTDDPLTAGASIIRAVHILELRDRINAARKEVGLAAFPWTDPTLTPASTVIRAQHVTELRAALSEAYVRAASPVPVFSDPSLGVGTFIKAAHIAELRAAVTAITGRHTFDQPDDVGGYQLKILYVLPRDGVDQHLDTNGTLGRSVEAWRRWLVQQSGGQGFRVDTRLGVIDIGFVRLSASDAEVASFGAFVREQVQAGVHAAGFNHPNKLYAAYYGGTSGLFLRRRLMAARSCRQCRRDVPEWGTSRRSTMQYECARRLTGSSWLFRVRDDSRGLSCPRIRGDLCAAPRVTGTCVG
jgi:hypothetical protein